LFISKTLLNRKERKERREKIFVFPAFFAVKNLTAGENGAKAGFGQDARDFLAFVALDFNVAFLHGAAAAAGFLHLFGELFFFRQADADKIFHHRHRLAAAMRGLAENVHAAAIFWAGGTLAGSFGSGSFRWRGRRQPIALQGGERRLIEGVAATIGNTFIAAHALTYLRGRGRASKILRIEAVRTEAGRASFRPALDVRDGLWGIAAAMPYRRRLAFFSAKG
jgi:hypothetical protein